ncbi:MAG: ParA family protein [Rubricoccaceae bacterium]|nr:ParA family protein [Rubricoccaceae bacterium]
MRIVTLANLKGGSAKTTSALSLAAALAAYDHAVLAIDLDPQASLTTYAGEDPGPEAARLLEGHLDHAIKPTRWFAPANQRCPPAGERSALHIVRADRSLVRLERNAPARLANHLVSLFQHVEDQYDYAFIDPPPQMSALVMAALAASDDVYVPIACGRGALDGLSDVVEITQSYGTAPVTGAFVTRVNVSSHHDTALATHVSETFGDNAFDTFVRETVRAREAEMARIPLPVFAPASTAAQDYGHLSFEVRRRTAAANPTA